MKNNGTANLSMLLIIIALSATAGVGFFAGYLKGGGKVEKVNLEEVSKVESASMYQYLPKDASLEEALSGGHYSHCVAFPGVGLIFSGKDQNGKLIVGEAPLTYPARRAEIFPGYKVLTPLEVISGDLNSPVKIEFQGEGLGFKTKEVILNRILVKKCYRKVPVGEALPDDAANDARSIMEQ